MSLLKFAYNNRYHASIGHAPFEALYGRKCSRPLCCWDTVGENAVLEIDRVFKGLSIVWLKFSNECELHKACI